MKNDSNLAYTIWAHSDVIQVIAAIVILFGLIIWLVFDSVRDHYEHKMDESYDEGFKDGLAQREGDVDALEIENEILKGSATDLVNRVGEVFEPPLTSEEEEVAAASFPWPTDDTR